MDRENIVHLVRTFGSIPKNVLIKQISKRLKISEQKADHIIISLANERAFYHDRSNDWLYKFKGVEKNYTAPFVLDLMLKLNKNSPIRLAKATYPFDYIFESEHTLYQVIDYFYEGIYKLNFKKNMEEDVGQEEKIIPIILLRDINIDAVPTSLYPKNDFYFATNEFDINDLTSIKTTLHFVKNGEIRSEENGF